MRNQVLVLALVLLPCGVLAEPRTAEIERVDQLWNEVNGLQGLGSHDIAIEVSRDSVELTGQVAREQDKQRIEEAISRVPWVETIDNEIEVAAQGRYAEDEVLTDIKSRIAAAGLGNYSIALSRIGDEITVSGDVPSENAADRVLGIVKSNPEVKNVRSQLKVKKQSEQQTLAQVQSIFNEMGISDRVTARMSGGELVLDGNLADRDTVDMVLSKVLMVPGVDDISSNILVSGQKYLTDAYFDRLRTVEAKGEQR